MVVVVCGSGDGDDDDDTEYAALNHCKVHCTRCSAILLLPSTQRRHPAHAHDQIARKHGASSSEEWCDAITCCVIVLCDCRLV